MTIGLHFVIQQRSEGSHFLMFFKKKEKEVILCRLQNDDVDFYKAASSSK
jgi:hypothetical protein